MHAELSLEHQVLKDVVEKDEFALERITTL
jgi:hypothetical protein